jgi:deoxyribodipyrimidine photo-lyase
MSPTPPRADHFCVELDDIHARLAHIDPAAYDKTRNHLAGATTWLGPFLTHGVISTTAVATAVRSRHPDDACYRLLFELGWREFFHRTWQHQGDAIFTDMRGPQKGVQAESPPRALMQGNIGIDAIDASIQHLIQHGTMHNHARMWVAAIACNLAHTHWREPARWLHYHLLDGDLASNTLSWQWVAGTFSNKRYIANQDNINRYSGSEQQGTWLDLSYEQLPDASLPDSLTEQAVAHYSPPPSLEAIEDLQLAPGTPLALRSIWNLDPHWRRDIKHHIVFIDCELYERWPLSENRWKLITHWADRSGAALFTGTSQRLTARLAQHEVVRQEYPACNAWPGTVEPRNWLYPMPEKSFNSFFAFWKQVKGSVGF